MTADDRVALLSAINMRDPDEKQLMVVAYQILKDAGLLSSHRESLRQSSAKPASAPRTLPHAAVRAQRPAVHASYLSTEFYVLMISQKTKSIEFARLKIKPHEPVLPILLTQPIRTDFPPSATIGVVGSRKRYVVFMSQSGMKRLKVDSSHTGRLCTGFLVTQTKI
jgi:hypothetical protein